MKCTFCDKEVISNWGVYCEDHKGKQERKKAADRNIMYLMGNNEKWAIIGTNSSLESLREAIGLKNTMPRQATTFMQLIKSITIMSKL